MGTGTPSGAEAGAPPRAARNRGATIVRAKTPRPTATRRRRQNTHGFVRGATGATYGASSWPVLSTVSSTITAAIESLLSKARISRTPVRRPLHERLFGVKPQIEQMFDSRAEHQYGL